MYKVAESVRSTHGQDGGIVLDTRQGQIFKLNLVGSTILEWLNRGLAETEVVERISREFGVSRELAACDLREFLAELEKHRLIEAQPAGSES